MPLPHVEDNLKVVKLQDELGLKFGEVEALSAIVSCTIPGLDAPIRGHMMVKNYRVSFKAFFDNAQAKSALAFYFADATNLPLSCMSSVTSPAPPAQSWVGYAFSYWSAPSAPSVEVNEAMDVVMKDVRKVRFTFGDANQRDAAIKTIKQLAFVGHDKLATDSFAIASYKALKMEDKKALAKYNKFTFEWPQEFTRLTTKPGSKPFKLELIDQGADYKQLPTYPRHIIVPKASTKEDLATSLQSV